MFFSHRCILQRAREAIWPFIFIDLFGCSPYVHGIVLLSVFIYMDLFSMFRFSALFSWNCFVIRLYLHGLDWMFAFTYMDLFECLPLFMLAGLVVYLYQH